MTYDNIKSHQKSEPLPEKRFDNFSNSIEPFKKYNSDEMKVEEAKNSRMCLN